MEKKTEYVYSPGLGREMCIKAYGHYGISILFFPAFTDKCTEIEESGVIDALESQIKMGKCKIFCVDSVDSEIWFGESTNTAHTKSELHYKYDGFIEEECMNYVFAQCGGPIPVITAGASKGAYHAANMFFRRPDIFFGTMALSGDYDLSHHTKEYFDDNCYFNSPVHYIPNLNDSYWLTFLYSRRHIYLQSGSAFDENPQNTIRLRDILDNKGIRNQSVIHGVDCGHNYIFWNEQFRHLVEKRL